jgi:hypothetical protein
MYKYSKFKFSDNINILKLPEFMKVNDLKMPNHMYWTNIWEDIKWFFGKYNDKDTSAWIPYREKLMKYIHNDVLDSKQQLPLKTKLYHGSKSPDLINNLKDYTTFLGLEPVISMWYTLEESVGFRGHNNTFSYVYEFEVIKPLPVNHIIQFLSNNPNSDKNCKNYGPVCLHPQVTFHGIEHPPFDLSIEVTLPLKKLIDEGYIKLNKSYRTILANLEDFSNYPIETLNVLTYKDFLLLWPKNKDLPSKDRLPD